MAVLHVCVLCTVHGAHDSGRNERSIAWQYKCAHCIALQYKCATCADNQEEVAAAHRESEEGQGVAWHTSGQRNVPPQEAWLRQHSRASSGGAKMKQGEPGLLDHATKTQHGADTEGPSSREDDVGAAQPEPQTSLFNQFRDMLEAHTEDPIEVAHSHKKDKWRKRRGRKWRSVSQDRSEEVEQLLNHRLNAVYEDADSEGEVNDAEMRRYLKEIEALEEQKQQAKEMNRKRRRETARADAQLMRQYNGTGDKSELLPRPRRPPGKGKPKKQGKAAASVRKQQSKAVLPGRKHRGSTNQHASAAEEPADDVQMLQLHRSGRLSATSTDSPVPAATHDARSGPEHCSGADETPSAQLRSPPAHASHTGPSGTERSGHRTQTSNVQVGVTAQRYAAQPPLGSPLQPLQHATVRHGGAANMTTVPSQGVTAMCRFTRSHRCAWFSGLLLLNLP